MEEFEKLKNWQRVSENLGISKSTAKLIYERYKFEGTFEKRKVSGRTRIVPLEDDKIIYEEVLQNPNVTADYIKEKIGDYVCSNTIRRRIREMKKRIQNEKNNKQTIR